MTLRVANGTALRTQKLRVRFDRIGHGGGHYRDFNIVELRRLLRTDLAISQIAELLGCEDKSLKRFIRRRNICDLTERRRFIELQRSLQKLPGEA